MPNPDSYRGKASEKFAETCGGLEWLPASWPKFALHVCTNYFLMPQWGIVCTIFCSTFCLDAESSKEIKPDGYRASEKFAKI